MIPKDEKLTGASTRRANPHLCFEGAANTKIKNLAEAQMVKKVFCLGAFAANVGDIIILPQPHEERDAFFRQPCEPVLSDKLTVADDALHAIATEQTQKALDKPLALACG